MVNKQHKRGGNKHPGRNPTSNARHLGAIVDIPPYDYFEKKPKVKKKISLQPLKFLEAVDKEVADNLQLHLSATPPHEGGRHRTSAGRPAKVGPAILLPAFGL